MAETAKDMVKKDLKKDKLKVPELDEKTKKHRDQMALLEIRAELEPYFIDNPLARLGFDVLERGEYLDGKGGGEILSYIVGNVDAGDSAYSTMGELIPSDKLDTEDRYPNKPLAKDILSRQGITSLLPTSEGSTVYFQQGVARGEDGELAYPNSGLYTEPKQGLSTLMHELSHLGSRVLVNRGYEFGNSFSEEEVMDAMEARAADKRGVPLANKKDLEDYRNYPLSTTAALKRADEATMPILKERGVPPQALQGTFKYEPGIMEKLLGIFK